MVATRKYERKCLALLAEDDHSILVYNTQSPSSLLPAPYMRFGRCSLEERERCFFKISLKGYAPIPLHCTGTAWPKRLELHIKVGATKSVGKNLEKSLTGKKWGLIPQPSSNALFAVGSLQTGASTYIQIECIVKQNILDAQNGPTCKLEFMRRLKKELKH